MMIRVNDMIINATDVTYAKWYEPTKRRSARLVLLLRHQQGRPLTLNGELATAVMVALCDACTHQFGTDVSLIVPTLWPEDTLQTLDRFLTSEDK